MNFRNKDKNFTAVSPCNRSAIFTNYNCILWRQRNRLNRQTKRKWISHQVIEHNVSISHQRFFYQGKMTSGFNWNLFFLGGGKYCIFFRKSCLISSLQFFFLSLGHPCFIVLPLLYNCIQSLLSSFLFLEGKIFFLTIPFRLKEYARLRSQQKK